MATIYVDRNGGAYEAFYYETDAGANRRYRSHDREEAIRKACRSYGIRRGEKFRECDLNSGSRVRSL